MFSPFLIPISARQWMGGKPWERRKIWPQLAKDGCPKTGPVRRNQKVGIHEEGFPKRRVSSLYPANFKAILWVHHVYEQLSSRGSHRGEIKSQASLHMGLPPNRRLKKQNGRVPFSCLLKCMGCPQSDSPTQQEINKSLEVGHLDHG